MTVRAILKAKGSSVVTSPANVSLHRISQLIAQYRIGAVIVVDEEGHPQGIVSERDIVNALSAFGAAALDMMAEEAMTRGLLTCTPEHTADDLLSMMTNSRVRHLPVIVDGRLTGIVSIGDVVKCKLDEAAAEVGLLRDYVMAGR